MSCLCMGLQPLLSQSTCSESAGWSCSSWPQRAPSCSQGWAQSSRSWDVHPSFTPTQSEASQSSKRSCTAALPDSSRDRALVELTKTFLSVCMAQRPPAWNAHSHAKMWAPVVSVTASNWAGSSWKSEGEIHGIRAVKLELSLCLSSAVPVLWQGHRNTTFVLLGYFTFAALTESHAVALWLFSPSFHNESYRAPSHVLLVMLNVCLFWGLSLQMR